MLDEEKSSIIMSEFDLYSYTYTQNITSEEAKKDIKDLEKNVSLDREIKGKARKEKVKIRGDLFGKSEKGRNGGYSISSTSLFPIRNMSHQEMRALTFSIERFLSKGNAVYARGAQVALDKLNALRKIETDRDRHIYFVQRSKPNYEFSNENRKYLQLQEALLAKRKVKIKYEKRSGERSERIIDLYGFVHYNEFFYCIAMCNDRNDTRIFKLSRIKNIQVLYDTYALPESFDIRREFPKFGLMNEPLEMELLIHPPFSVSVPESIWGENQTIKYNSDKSIVFRATMNGKEPIKRWILGMGASVKVIAPKSLREEIIEEGRKLLGVYDLLLVREKQSMY